MWDREERGRYSEDKGPVVEIMGDYLNGVKDMDRKESERLPAFSTQMRPEGGCQQGELVWW